MRQGRILGSGASGETESDNHNSGRKVFAEKSSVFRDSRVGHLRPLFPETQRTALAQKALASAPNTALY